MLFDPDTGKPAIVKHNTFPFGAMASVWAYGRVAEAVLHVIVTLLKIMAYHYVDDWWMVSPAFQAGQMYRMFIRMHRLIGFECAMDKSFEPSSVLELLGVNLDLTGGTTKLEVTPARRDVLTHQIMGVLK